MNKDILDFINIVQTHNENIRPEDICEHYSAGFCYHFAIMLTNLFKGRVMWLYKRSHIVFFSEEGICYDIWGVFTDYTDSELYSLDTLSPTALAGFTKMKGYNLQVVAQGDVSDTICWLLYEDGTLSFNGIGYLEYTDIDTISVDCQAEGLFVTNTEVATAIQRCSK